MDRSLAQRLALGAWSALLIGIASPAEAITYPIQLIQNTTGVADSVFLGPPDGIYRGLGGQYVTYDFGLHAVLNRPHLPDFNVYELDNGTAEFHLMSVFVSNDGIAFISVKASEGAALNLIGDEPRDNPTFVRSYNLPDGWASARYIRVDGNGNGAAGKSVGFDLDAIGAAQTASTPEAAATAGLLALGLAGLAGYRLSLWPFGSPS